MIIKKFNFLNLFIICFLNSYAQINFTENTVDSTVHGFAGIFAIDLDKDYDCDILAASLEDNQIIWWRNDGGNPVHWTKIVIGYNVYSAHSVYAADIDNDNDYDVVGAAYYGAPGISWWRNDGGDPIQWTKFPVSNYFNNAHEIFCIDLDKDSDIDVLGASSDSNKIAWWRNDGGNPIHWTEQVISSNVLMAKSVCACDLDGDFDMDVIAAALGGNSIFWWRNDGGQPIKWTQFLVDGNFIGAHRVQCADLNKDGKQDILGAAYMGGLIAWWKNSGGDSIIWKRQNIASNYTNACVAFSSDLDNDGDSDIVATAQGKNEISWWRNGGDTLISWTRFNITNTFTRPWPLFVCDLDGDMRKDIISGSSHNGSNQIKWWKNEGSIGINESKEVLNDFILYQNYPNPFNPETTIKFNIKENSFTTLKIYNILGKEIASLINSGLKVGTYEVTISFDKISSIQLPSGIYIYKLTCMGREEISNTKKMIFLK